ncbi:transketolase [Streptomyces sp. NPDC048594]|uniref:transketolase n=1 Tax=Streptomyces sp. NPDC048594 TaxID=3365575 RepID=UPI0037107A6F
MSGRGTVDVVDELTDFGQVDTRLPLGEQIDALRAVAAWVRRVSLHRAHTTGQGHLGGEFSATDILVALYCAAMRLPESAERPDTGADRLILSKGHAVVALYAVMVAAGVLHPSRLRAGRRDDLPGHPVRGSVPGITATTGSLGHGLPLGVGAALGARLDGSGSRTFVVLGDGELQEGSNWEAFMLAAHLRLGNLTAIVDANRLQQGGRVCDTNSLEPLPEKLESFGWRCSVIDGHDFGTLLGTLRRPPGDATGAPTAVVTRTTKGHGVSFMADDPSWHHRIPDAQELARAAAELDG